MGKICYFNGSVNLPITDRLILNRGYAGYAGGLHLIEDLYASVRLELLQNGVDADMRLKRKALERVTPTDSRQGRYNPDDALLAFLEAL